VPRDLAFANDWIAARAGLSPTPPSCTPFTPTTCTTPPPNL
jgi:hypothetical protein